MSRFARCSRVIDQDARLLNSRSARQQSGTLESSSQNSKGVSLRDEYDCFWQLAANSGSPIGTTSSTHFLVRFWDLNSRSGGVIVVQRGEMDGDMNICDGRLLYTPENAKGGGLTRSSACLASKNDSQMTHKAPAAGGYPSIDHHLTYILPTSTCSALEYITLVVLQTTLTVAL